jgi:hypothetical protein
MISLTFPRIVRKNQRKGRKKKEVHKSHNVIIKGNYVVTGQVNNFIEIPF